MADRTENQEILFMKEKGSSRGITLVRSNIQIQHIQFGFLVSFLMMSKSNLHSKKITFFRGWILNDS